MGAIEGKVRGSWANRACIVPQHRGLGLGQCLPQSLSDKHIMPLALFTQVPSLPRGARALQTRVTTCCLPEDGCSHLQAGWGEKLRPRAEQ